jgi:SAM-dependent methyltransferase
MSGYYRNRLAGARLRRCYEIASPRVQQYLEEEIQKLLEVLRPRDVVLELGCGYGRVAHRLLAKASRVTGIDTSEESLAAVREFSAPNSRVTFVCMDAVQLGFASGSFDAVVCVQNGICAFQVDPEALVRESLRVSKPGGQVIVSTYADRFWPHRLAWFEAQAAAGLLGPIDRERSRDGTIVCTDGFRAGRMPPDELRSLADRVGVRATIEEVDRSSVFCRFDVPVST